MDTKLVMSKTCISAPGGFWSSWEAGVEPPELPGIKFIFESFVPLGREELLFMEGSLWATIYF